jgi:hypothetical protein
MHGEPFVRRVGVAAGMAVLALAGSLDTMTGVASAAPCCSFLPSKREEPTKIVLALDKAVEALAITVLSRRTDGIGNQAE